MFGTFKIIISFISNDKYIILKESTRVVFSGYYAATLNYNIF